MKVQEWDRHISTKRRGDEYLTAYFSHLNGEKSELDNDLGSKVGRLKFLVADDDTMLLSTIVMQLAERGFQSVMAKDFITLKEQLKTEGLNVALLDYSFPEKNGVEIAEWIEKESKFRKGVIIVMSAYARAKEHANQKKVAFIEKPFTMDELLVEIKRQAQKRNFNRGLNNQINVKSLPRKVYGKSGFLYSGFLADVRELFSYSVD
jgi:DNA-binding NtrC family response regulator